MARNSAVPQIEPKRHSSQSVKLTVLLTLCYKKSAGTALASSAGLGDVATQRFAARPAAAEEAMVPSPSNRQMSP